MNTRKKSKKIEVKEEFIKLIPTKTLNILKKKSINKALNISKMF